jgi:hypothetical protein
MNNAELCERFHTLFDQHSRVEIYLDINKGWHAPVIEMLERLANEQGNTPAMRITQLKMKWGCLRVTGDGFSHQADAIVEEAEKRTAEICEICGAPGEPDINLRGITIGVRCANHARQNKKEKAEISAAQKSSKVGIFFVVNGDIIFDAVPLDQGEPYGDTVGFSAHADFWEALVPKTSAERLFKSHPYDYYPRGRVVYFKDILGFKLYADRCITDTDSKKIIATFQLPTGMLSWHRDQHYQCSRCHRGYVDI